MAITIGSLHTLTRNPHNSFAVNLSAITTRGGDGEFQQLLLRALGGGLDFGVGHNTILWAAAFLWGGASLASHGNKPIGDNVLGIVAPQCTIILDFIRDPLSLARHGLNAPLLSIYRGAVPLLGQDPTTGLVMARKNYSMPVRPSSKIDCRDIAPGRRQTSSALPNPGDLLITFEAGFSEAIQDNLFIAWYKGEMTFQMNPRVVFENLLMRRYVSAGRSTIPLQREALPYCLDFMELMRKPNCWVDHGPAVFFAGSDPAWLVAAAGCPNDIGYVAICIGELDVKGAGKDDLIVYCEL